MVTTIFSRSQAINKRWAALPGLRLADTRLSWPLIGCDQHFIFLQQTCNSELDNWTSDNFVEETFCNKYNAEGLVLPFNFRLLFPSRVRVIQPIKMCYNVHNTPQCSYYSRKCVALKLWQNIPTDIKNIYYRSYFIHFKIHIPRPDLELIMINNIQVWDEDLYLGVLSDPSSFNSCIETISRSFFKTLIQSLTY